MLRVFDRVRPLASPKYSARTAFPASWRSRVSILISLFIITIVSSGYAAAQTITFETYTPGSINGQDGWSKTGSYDHAVSSSLGTAGFGAQSYRMSNAITSGGFADQTYSRSLANEAGETTAANNGLSGGTRQKNFELQFGFASAVPGAQQPGMAMSVSPDRGDGARMSYLRFEDQANGIHVFFDDYQDLAPFGTAIGDAANGCDAGGDNFTDIDIATLARNVPHTIKFAIFFIDGPRNDVVQIYIDGVLVKTGTTWEDYSRYCQNSQPATVDSLLMRTAGASAATSGNGFLFDNMDFASSTSATNLVVDDDGLGSAADCNAATPAYSSISAAAAAANPGDTVRVCSGTYSAPNTIELNKVGLTLLGVGPTKPVIQASIATVGSGNHNAFHVSASNITMENLEIQKTDVTGVQELIWVQADNFTAKNNLIYGANPGMTWDAAGQISRAFIVSVSNNLLLQNNTIHTLRQPAYMSGSATSGGSITGNNVSGTKGWVVEGGNFAFSGNTWGEPQNQSCDIALIPSVAPANNAFYEPLLTLSTNNDNAFVCAQYAGGENGRATAYVNDGAAPGGNGSDNANYQSINTAVAGALNGGTVSVAAGTYNEDVTVGKSVKVIGAGATGTTVSGPIGGGASTFAIAANNVEISGFTITRAGNNLTDWNDPGLNSAGVSVQGLAISGLLFHDNTITGMRTGIDINNSNGHTIRNNVIDNNRTGFIFRNQTDNLTIVENTITNNWTVGVLFLDGSGGTNVPVQTAVNCTFFNNNLSGNWYGQIVDRQSGGSLPAAGTNLKNFSGNWFGTASPVVTTANSAEPGYAAQIPVAYGGAAVPPGGQPDIAGTASANFDYSPYLNAGSDSNVQTTPGRGTYGFQGSFNSLSVSAASAQTSAVSKIQEAINLITAGGLLAVPAGSYPGNVNVNKALTITGSFTVGGTFTTSAAGVVLNPGTSPGIINSGSLSLGSGTTVNMEINGTVAGANYDQFNVTGTVGIAPNVNLNLIVGYVPGAGHSYTIINNDSSDPVTGAFNGLPDDAVFYVGSNSFTINYNGGDGNDVVVTAVSLCNAVSIPTNITTLTGTTVVAPVNVDDTTGNGLISTDFWVSYNPSVVTVNSVALGSVTGAGTLTTNSTPGLLKVSVFSSTPFAGAGPLVNITFNAIGAPGTSSPVTFTQFKFNEGTPCVSTSNGLITILSGTITGTVTYGNELTGGGPSPRHVPNVTLNAVGSVNVSTTTANNGTYTLSGMGAGAYTVTPTKTGEDFGALTGNDSAVIAQFVVGLVSLNANQQTVADVSGAGGITSFDAALIARYVVALPGSGSSGTWRFIPVSRSYPNVNSNQTAQDYSALLMGDVTGSWLNPAGTRPAAARGGSKGIRVTAGDVTASPKSAITVPVTVAADISGKGIVAYQFELAYDPKVIEPQAVPVELIGTISDKMTVTANAETQGILKVVVFGALPLEGKGPLFNLKFTAVGGEGDETPLTLQNFIFNEGDQRNVTTDGKVKITAQPEDEASIEGRLLSPKGDMLPDTGVILTNSNTGESWTVLSNAFGIYRFGGIKVGHTYIVSTLSKQFVFAPQAITVLSDMSDVNLRAQP